ncbi:MULTISPECIES: YegP family protein [unclassified Sphingomonas]|uniref:YegP family protein n=1 Tax=unclassified Sphingomonas TaxID=196159 RepID=UPI0009EB7898|nr:MULTISPECIES: DUF1508 domain-containing protein [unclassified Sphingomonas]
MYYYLYRDNANLWRWTFVSSNGRTIAVSSESYYNKSDAQNGINLVKGSLYAPVRE